MFIQKSILGLLIGVLLYTQPVQGTKQDNNFHFLQTTALPIAEGFLAEPLISFLCILGHEFGHSLAHKIQTGEFATMHIGSLEQNHEPLFSLGKRLKVHIDTAEGVAIQHNREKQSKQQRFLSVLAGPLSGIATSFLLQGALQIALSYQETNNLGAAIKNSVLNGLSPFDAIVKNKKLSLPRKRMLIVISALIVKRAIFNGLYIWRPERGMAKGDGAKILNYLSDGKETPEWVFKASGGADYVMDTALYFFAIRALLKVQAQEEVILQKTLNVGL